MSSFSKILFFAFYLSISLASCVSRIDCTNAEPMDSSLYIDYVDSSGNTLVGPGMTYDPDSISVTVNSVSIPFYTHEYQRGIKILFDDVLNIADPIFIRLNSNDTDTLVFHCMKVQPGPEDCFPSYPISSCKYNGVDQSPYQMFIEK